MMCLDLSFCRLNALSSFLPLQRSRNTVANSSILSNKSCKLEAGTSIAQSTIRQDHLYKDHQTIQAWCPLLCTVLHYNPSITSQHV
jgi:hypothetical protein